MRTMHTLTSLLLLSAVCITPVYANWFSNSRTNVMMNIGSAPNPTPADLRAVEPWRYAAPVAEVAPPAVTSDEELYDNGLNEEDSYMSSMNTAALAGLEGKTVFGVHGERLGVILTTDHHSRMAELQTPGGVAIAMPAALLVDQGRRVTAPTTSRADVMAMAKTQTGRTVAQVVDMRRRASRG